MPVPCNRCEAPLPKWELAAQQQALCPDCQALNYVRVFPALLAPPRPATRAEEALPGDAACFDHPGKRAVASCQQCGRFVCQLCSVSIGAGVWCPSCFAAGLHNRGLPEQSRTLYDSIALTLALAPLLFWPITLISAPAAFYVAVRHWKKPLGLTRRTRARFVIAMLLALAQITAWVWGIAYGIAQMRMRT